MDNIITQPSHLNIFDGITPAGLTSNELSHQNLQDKLTQASALDELNKKINEFNVEQDNFAKHKKRETEKLEAKQKVLDEQEARNKRDRNLIDADKKRVNEQTNQARQDKAKNDARKKELDILEENLQREVSLSENFLKLIDDHHNKLDSATKRTSINLERLEDGLQKVYGTQDHLESHLNYDEQFAILFQKLADNDVKNDLILEELNKLEVPQVKKQTNTQLDLPKIDVSVKSSIRQTILSNSYKFTDLNGNDLGKCKSDNLIANLYDLEYDNDLEVNTLLFIFEDNTEVEFNALSAENQQHFIDFQKSS